MEKTERIKKDLIQKIENLDDMEFLVALQNLLNTQSSLFELNSDQMHSIYKGRRDIQEGNYRSNEKVMEELQEWLKK